MTEPQLSTKAPESDIHEDLEDEPLATDKDALTPIPVSESTNATAERLSEHCVTDRPLSSSESPSGTIATWNSAEVYVSKPSDYPTTPARLLLLLTTGAGIHSQNNQYQADMFARQGYLVVMPDLFDKDPAPNTKPTEPETGEASWLDTVKLKAAETAKSFMIDMWLARQTPEKVLPIVHAVIKQAREEFSDAVSNGGGIYSVGYCFGGKYVLTLAGERPDSEMTGREATAEEGQIRRAPEIKCGSCAHGTLVSKNDVRDLKAPIQIVAVEDDPLFPEEVLEAARRELEERGVEHEIEVYKGVPHGFAVAGDYESKAIQKAQARAFSAMVKWLNAH